VDFFVVFKTMNRIKQLNNDEQQNAILLSIIHAHNISNVNSETC